MTRTLIFILSLGIAAALPATASATCGTTQGSFSVSCTQGVKVYRHNALSAIPRGLSPAQANLETAKLQAKTDRARIAAQERSNLRAAKLRERELEQERVRNLIYLRNSRRIASPVGVYGKRGFSFGHPVHIRSGSLNTGQF